jgi:hypothetical protein
MSSVLDPDRSCPRKLAMIRAYDRRMDLGSGRRATSSTTTSRSIRYVADELEPGGR